MMDGSDPNPNAAARPKCCCRQTVKILETIFARNRFKIPPGAKFQKDAGWFLKFDLKRIRGERNSQHICAVVSPSVSRVRICMKTSRAVEKEKDEIQCLPISDRHIQHKKEK
jgi:hypothetical protein